MKNRLAALQQKLDGAIKDLRRITSAAEGASRDITAEEEGQIKNLMATIDKLSAQIEDEKRVQAAERQLEPSATAIERRPENVGNPQSAADPTGGFANFSEFAQAVRVAQAGRVVDSRLAPTAAAPGTYGSEGIGQDGGFVIPPAYSTEIWRHSLAEDSLLPLTDNTEVTGNSMVFPKDETTPWGTDGVRAYWANEAAAANATKPKLGTATLRLSKLLALIPLTDELLSDGAALGPYVTDKASTSIRWKTNEGILFGNGNGQPQGAFNAGAAVVVAKESGQATQTLQILNVAKMIARLPPGSFPRALWMMGPDALPALFTLTLGNYPIYLPPTPSGTQGGAQLSPYGTLMGRPITISQHAPAFSAQGDVSLMDLSYYRTITKAGGVETATSMHLYFDADATAFRVTFRVDGQSKIAAAITQAKGSNTLSPYVQLQAR